MFNLTSNEKKIFKKLNTSAKIQDFLETIPINFEANGETLISPRQVLISNKAHCVEGALLAAAVLWFHGQKPLLLDLRATTNDLDHVVALFFDEYNRKNTPQIYFGSGKDKDGEIPVRPAKIW